MKLHQLHSRQYLPISQKVAWDFLANPNNLKLITPTAMGFEILSGTDKAMFSGQIIQYNVTPLPGYSTRWVSEITQVNEGNYFVDEQRFGPYALWHHKHFIHETKNGVEIEDIIDYKIPFGIFGRIAHALFIKKQLITIFKYREDKLIELFGRVENEPNKLDLQTI